VTVLFADLVDSTAHAERLDPEDLRRLLSPYFRRVRAEVERFGGTVEKFIGDAVMAVFGAPVAHEDDPERAVRAALAVRDAVAELNEETEVTELHVRIAVNTGEAMVDLDAGEGEGIVAGDVVNTASRLQGVAPIDGILVGETTYRATAVAIEYRKVEAVRAKGKRKPVPSWEAVEPSDGSPRPPTPLVGRWQELSQVLDALVRVREERTPELVSLVGVPGIGKTRLARELVSAVEAEPDFASWLSGRCLPYGDGVSFAALAEMARTATGILTTDPADKAQEKLRATLEDLLSGHEAAWLEGHLAPLVGLGGEAGRREDSLPAWRRFFEALAESGPLLLVFEDLHWADPAVLDFVDHLVEWASGVPLLVVCTARPELLERRPDWGGGKRNAITISLSPLSDKDTGELVRALLAQEELPAGVAEPVLARAGGNPLYAEEYARMLVERGFLVRENGSWRLATADLPLPESVHATIAARVDGLLAEEKVTLQQAAVVGKVFWLGAVAEGAGLERARAERLLHTLERKEFVRRERHSSVADEEQYAFRHVLVRDVAYGQLPRSRRAEAHVQAAVWLESLAGGGEELAEQLAHHYESALELTQATGRELGELPDRTRKALTTAGERALALSAFPAAVGFFSRALELCPRSAPERPRLLLRLGRARFLAEGRGAEELDDALEGLITAGDNEAAAEAETILSNLVWARGNRDAAAIHVERAVDLLAAAPPSAAKAYVLGTVALFHGLADEPESAIAAGREALAMAEQLGLPDVRARALRAVANARVKLGDWDGLADYERSLEVGGERDSVEQINTCINFAGAVISYGDLPRAFGLQDKARILAKRFGNQPGLRWLTGERSFEYYWRGRWAEAFTTAGEVIARSESEGGFYMEIPCRVVRGEIALVRGDVEAADADAEAALAAARGVKDLQALAPTLAFAARVRLEAGREDEANALASELLAAFSGQDFALALAGTDLAFVLNALGRDDDLGLAIGSSSSTRWWEAASSIAEHDFPQAAHRFAEIGSLPDEAFARLQAGALLLERGDHERARAELDQAVAFFEHTRADERLRQAQRLLALL
jgi:class 3 adenylate cyclase/tetratricopeptide (TPR) repeat protein